MWDNVNDLHAYCAPGLHFFSCRKSRVTALLLDYLSGVSSGTLIPCVWLVTEHRQTVGLAQTKSSDKEELLPGESQEKMICFFFNHFLCLLFLFSPLFPLFVLFCIASKMQHSVRLGFFWFCFCFCLCLPISPLLCWSWCLAVLCAVSETASGHKDPAVCVNFIKVLADWHFHTCKEASCVQVGFYLFFLSTSHKSAFLSARNMFKTSCTLEGEKVRSKLMRRCLAGLNI